MNYDEAKAMIVERVEKSRNDVGIFDLYSMIFADDLHVIINIIDELEMADDSEKLHWEYGYLLGQAMGNLDTTESILHYFGKTMGEHETTLRDAYIAIEAKLVSLHPVLN